MEQILGLEPALWGGTEGPRANSCSLANPLQQLPFLPARARPALLLWMAGSTLSSSHAVKCAIPNSPHMLSKHRVSTSRVPGTVGTKRYVANQIQFSIHAVEKCQSLSHIQLCNPRDGSPPGSSVHGTLQARILE